MEGRKMKVFGVVMTLLLVFSLAATFSVSSTSTVSAGTQKWSKISIPSTNNMQLAPGTDVGAIAMSPDGATLFAAVYNELAETWNVTKSLDGGYTWKLTGLTAAFLAGQNDSTDIVAIKTSPDWKNDDIVVVATANNAYVSEDRGKTFQSMSATGLGDISSLDVALNKDGNATYLLGTETDVYILSGFASWKAQYVGNGYSDFYGVLAAAFSPNYGQDGVVFAIVQVDDAFLGRATYLRAESDITVNNWGSFIDDAPFMDKLYTNYNVPIFADKACMAFASDYNSAPSVFVGLSNNSVENGDAFLVDLVQGTIGTSHITNLNIRGDKIESNVNSLAVSGNASSAFILAGLVNLQNWGPMSSWVGDVHYSSNGGESWLQSYKPASGLEMEELCAPIVLMAPDFATSGVAYCGDGFISRDQPTLFSGFYVSTTQGTTWNGRGLLDHTITDIKDIRPSPNYENDSTLFMVTNSSALIAGSPAINLGTLWETKDGGTQWELTLGMTTMIPLPGVAIDKIQIPSQYPQEPSIFVTGSHSVPLGGSPGPSNIIIRSTDEGNLFATSINAPSKDGAPLTVDTWAVINKDTIIVSHASTIWKTTDMGAHWIEATDEPTEAVYDLQLYNDSSILVGTSDGTVYLCKNLATDFSFTQVGTTTLSGNVSVAFDTNFGQNGFVYAGTDTGSFTGGVWRTDANSADTWDPMPIPFTNYQADISSIKCDGNGILWAIGSNSSGPDPTSKAIRCVQPTDDIDKVTFEAITDGLTSNLWSHLVTAPTATYVFAIGGGINASDPHAELWAYIDTLIKPTLISPANGATAVGTIIGSAEEGASDAHVTLMWNSMPKAKWYDYEVAYDPDFGSLVFSPAITTTEGTQASVTLFLGEKYYWRVRVNGSPVFSQWSDTWSFTTPLGPSSVNPALTSPSAGQTGVGLNTTLQWSSSVDATGYELIVAPNCDWSHPVINLTGSSALGADTTAYHITQALQQGTSYCWKVRAVNANTATNSPWSDTGTFTTLTIPVVKEAGTPTWVWVVIALSAVLLVAVVVLIARTRRPI